MPAHAGCLGMIKGKSWVVLAFRNNSTTKILTFENLDTSDTCSSWIKRFVLKSDEGGERKKWTFLSTGRSALRAPSLPSPPSKGGRFIPWSHPVQTGLVAGSVTLRPEFCTFRTPTVMCLVFVVFVGVEWGWWKQGLCLPFFSCPRSLGSGYMAGLPGDACRWAYKDMCQAHRGPGLGDLLHQSIVWFVSSLQPSSPWGLFEMSSLEPSSGGDEREVEQNQPYFDSC